MDFDLGRVLNEAYRDVSKTLLENGAPLLGAVVGGPPGLAAAGVSILSKALGIPVEDPRAIATRLVHDPEARKLAREAEAENQALLAQYNLEIYKAEAADRASARAREASIAQATGKADPTVRQMAWVHTIGFYVSTAAYIWVVFYSKDPLLFGLVGTAFGANSSNVSQIISYFFGSSASSARKDASLKDLAMSVSEQQSQPQAIAVASSEPIKQESKP